MATKNSTALKIVPTTPKTKAVKTPESIREAIIQEVLDAMSMGDCFDPPPTSREGLYDDQDGFINNHFAYGASQLNADLALAAQCEFEGDFDFGVTDEDALEFYNSSEFEKAKKTFVDDLKERLRAKIENRPPIGADDPLVNFARRMRYSGLLSPERKEPDSDYVRRERRKHRRLRPQPASGTE